MRDPARQGPTESGEVERLRQELATIRSRFRGLVDRIADGIVVLGDDGLIRFANDAATALLGVDVAELVGSPFPSAGSVDDGREIEVVRDGETRVIELQAAETDWDGEPARIVSLRDITARVTSEQRARELVREQASRAEAEEQAHRARFLAEAGRRLSSTLALEQTLQTVVDLVVEQLADYALIDLVEGDEVRRFMTARDPELGAELDAAIRHPLDVEADTPQARAYREREPVLVRQTDDDWLRSAAQDEGHLELLRQIGPRSVLFVPIHSGRECMGVLSAARTGDAAFRLADLHLTAELGRHAAMALENARLYRDSQAANESKGNFLSVMSHELRTPLSAIIGYTDLIDRGVAGEPTEKQRAYLGRIRASSNHLLQIIEEILAFAGAEAGEQTLSAEDLTMDELLEGVRTVAEPLAADTSLEFRIVVEDDEARLHTDERKVRQVLLNLISNALKFTEEGYVEVRARTTADRAIFEVEDTGIGIPEDRLESIFDRFSQLESALTRRAGGTGLGLSVARTFARSLGGTLTAESERDVGSTFTLDIPRRVAGSGNPPGR